MDDKGHDELMRSLNPDAKRYRQDWIDEKLTNSRLKAEITRLRAREDRLVARLADVEEAFLHLHGWVRSWDCAFKTDRDWLENDGPIIFKVADDLMASRTAAALLAEAAGEIA
jgi:hypothetical protein